MASREQFLQRRDNLCAILGILRQRGAMTRSEVAQALGLSWERSRAERPTLTATMAAARAIFSCQGRSIFRA